MASKEKVDIKRSDDFEEVDEELSRAIADLDFTIERVTAIFDGTSDENTATDGAPEVEEEGGSETGDSEQRREMKSAIQPESDESTPEKSPRAEVRDDAVEPDAQ